MRGGGLLPHQRNRGDARFASAARGGDHDFAAQRLCIEPTFAGEYEIDLSRALIETHGVEHEIGARAQARAGERG
jgi:hypothetical protein